MGSPIRAPFAGRKNNVVRHAELKLDPESFAGRVLVEFGFRVLQLWARTIRFQFEDRGGIFALPLAHRLVGASWHNRLLFLPRSIRCFFPHRQGLGLISASRDGDLVCDTRPSVQATHGARIEFPKGRSCLITTGRLHRRRRDGVLITPDGPRGPVYQLGGGVIFLAQKTGAPVRPMHLEYSSCWRLKSWDRFILPRPFARARYFRGPTYQVAATKTEEEFERERVAKSKLCLMAMVETR